jgi:tRNA-dihydrouridine synthase B
MSQYNRENSTFSLRGLTISPPIALAPMVGLSHSALRSLHAERGGVGLFFTEMLTARRLPHDSPLCSPLLVKSRGEWPLFYQLVTGDPAEVKPAVDRVHQLEGQGIDLNLGCPAPMICKLGAGLALLDDRRRLHAVVSELRKCTELPVSVKLRLGKVGDVQALKNLCLFLEGEGVDLITIHARLDGEKFCRHPRWSIVAEVRPSISVPLLLNGGIFSVDDARRCLNITGASGLMIGRGAVRHPGLSADIATELFGWTQDVVTPSNKEQFFIFFRLLEERFAPERRLGRLKQFTAYFAEPLFFGHQLSSAVQSSTSMVEAGEKAEFYFSHDFAEQEETDHHDRADKKSGLHWNGSSKPDQRQDR